MPISYEEVNKPNPTAPLIQDVHVLINSVHTLINDTTLYLNSAKPDDIVWDEIQDSLLWSDDYSPWEEEALPWQKGERTTPEYTIIQKPS